MSIGDLLEWLAAAAVTACAYLWGGIVPCLLSAALCLGYLAQCYDRPLWRRKQQ